MTQAYRLEDPEIIRRQPVTTAVVRATVRMDELASFYDRAFGRVAEVLGNQGVRPMGAAFGLYRSMPGETVDLEVGFPTENAVVPDDDVILSELPGGDIARASHVGDYDGLAGSWQELGSWIASQGRRPAQAMWEEYVTEPSPDTDPATLRTDLYWLLAG